MSDPDELARSLLRATLESTADEMGAVLKRTSFSPNIKERMDASCAVFDAKAQLVAQARVDPEGVGVDLGPDRVQVHEGAPLGQGHGDLGHPGLAGPAGLLETAGSLRVTKTVNRSGLPRTVRAISNR